MAKMQPCFAFAPRRKSFLFGRKRKTGNLRPGAIPGNEVKKTIEKIGINRKATIRRIDVFGHPEDKTLEVIIVGIFDDHFAAKVVNPERRLIEATDAQKVYIKGGGGTVDFFYSDGDIKEIIEDIDEEIMTEVDRETVREIIGALEEGDDVRVSYFDEKERTAVNCIGKLLKKHSDEHFIVLAQQVNTVMLEKGHEIEIDLSRDPVLDIQII
jgi:hypothetical protein